MEELDRIIDLLHRRKNVLLVGAPGTGKSRIMNEIATVFEKGWTSSGRMQHVPSGPVPIPGSKGDCFRFLENKTTKVFRTSMHQNSKYRDFITGIVPKINSNNEFKVSEGILYRANEFAKNQNHVALLVIDELNRGPAVEVFGDSIVAIEPDKRTDEKGEQTPTTQSFEILDPKDGSFINYALSPNLYIIAAMNQADVSVAPLDVAFLRRWFVYRLRPNYECLKEEFKIDANNISKGSSEEALHIGIEALRRINNLISISKGEDYSIGQGVFLSSKPRSNGYDDVLDFLVETWQGIISHLNELYYGDSSAIGFIINAKSPTSPYEVKDVEFNEVQKSILESPGITNANILDVYKAVLEDR